MKFELPENHGLSTGTLGTLVFKDSDKYAFTDAQHDALSAGVGRGESALIVSPTSTGKTQIALWAIARSLEQGRRTVYLVTHRALAKQKFEDFKTQLLAPYLGANLASLVVATGDYVEDADGQVPAEPLGAPLLVATYEKYLALVSASGIPTDMTSTVIVCDEIQLIGDANRGQNVEVLLTLIRNAGCRQFVGLSAVLQPKDASDLANWLNVKLVIQHTREKHLRYECWSQSGIAAASSAHPDRIDEGLPPPAGVDRNSISVLISLLQEKKPPVPIIVFCMTKKETIELANGFIATAKKGVKGQLSLAFDGLPETSANTFLASILEHRVAIHTADLMDEERHVVEQHLLQGKLDVVFATSTLAAGVNFPLGAAIFSTWARWNSDSRTRVPIDSGEFHNMAGRVGRMGFSHDHGRVIFFANDEMQAKAARQFLQLGELPSIEPRVTPERFNQLALQLVASALCASRVEIENLVCNTFSALREKDRNSAGFARWPEALANAVNELVANGLLIETSTGRLSATPVGKAIGNSGLLPETGIFLLNYVVSKAERLVSLLPTKDAPGDIPRLAFLLFSGCLSSPEFRPQAKVRPTRFLPWPLARPTLFNADIYRTDLVEPVWHADLLPINSAKLCCDWIDGAEFRTLEMTVGELSAGMLRELFRNLCWTMQGLASILAAASDARVPPDCRPPALRSPDTKFDAITKLPRLIRRLSYRVSEGLPDDVLWMNGLNIPGGDFRLSRSELLALRRAGYSSPEKVMLGSKEADTARVATFAKAKPTPHAKANWLRDACRLWKTDYRQRAAERHRKRVRHCVRPELIDTYYSATGTDFEAIFEQILAFLNIDFEKLDNKDITGAPDYLLKLKDAAPLIVELKTREGEKLVDYNKAVEVLSASEVHGHKDTFCVTLCHPGVDPSVPLVIAACGRLSVVESTDLGEALIRLCEGTITQGQLWQWLASPGQAIASDLPFRDYS